MLPAHPAHSIHSSLPRPSSHRPPRLNTAHPATAHLRLPLAEHPHRLPSLIPPAHDQESSTGNGIAPVASQSGTTLRVPCAARAPGWSPRFLMPGQRFGKRKLGPECGARRLFPPPTRCIGMHCRTPLPVSLRIDVGGSMSPGGSHRKCATRFVGWTGWLFGEDDSDALLSRRMLCSFVK